VDEVPAREVALELKLTAIEAECHPKEGRQVSNG
jgi:hypothetical protein